ncbi:MAG: hypothetical protein WA817_24360 [Candidatus Acidiferrum sp.]
MSYRRKEHDVDALLLLDRFMRIPQDAPLAAWPSTAELQSERIFGLRPVNRIGDLKKGEFNHHRYDFEMISCGRGVNRWRLHWPNRPGYPKHKAQAVLSLADSDSQPHYAARNMSRARTSRGSWRPRAIIPQQPVLFDVNVRP